jgi:hypothetical protein
MKQKPVSEKPEVLYSLAKTQKNRAFLQACFFNGGI